jgi:RNA methyltransferase, TrmH family
MGGSLVTTIRDLHRRRGRERRGLALAEGVRLVEEALAARVPIRGAAVAPGLEGTPRGTALKSALERAGVRLEAVSDAELARLADTEHPQGVVAVLEPPTWRLEDIVPAPGAPILVLDALQDPGNVGTILRTALALAGAGVIALEGTTDLHNSKVLRGSMGALFRLPAVATDTSAYLAWAGALGIETWVTAADGDPLRPGGAAQRRHGPVALVLGNEGAGVGAALSQAAHRRVAIPLARGVESLNVAVAAGIFLYEVARGV